MDARVAGRLLLLWRISCAKGPASFAAEAGASPETVAVLAAAVLVAVAAAVLLMLLLQLAGRAVGRVGRGVGVAAAAAAAASVLLLLWRVWCGLRLAVRRLLRRVCRLLLLWVGLGVQLGVRQACVLQAELLQIVCQATLGWIGPLLRIGWWMRCSWICLLTCCSWICLLLCCCSWRVHVCSEGLHRWVGASIVAGRGMPWIHAVDQEAAPASCKGARLAEQQQSPECSEPCNHHRQLQEGFKSSRRMAHCSERQQFAAEAANPRVIVLVTPVQVEKT